MTSDPVVHAHHDRWTPVPGTVFEVHQASGTNVAVYLIDDTDGTEITFDVDAPVRVRLTHKTPAIRLFGVAMHANPDNEDPSDQVLRSGIAYRQAVGQHQAQEWAAGMNAFANSPNGRRYWVARAEVVTRNRILLDDGGEIWTPWKTVEQAQTQPEAGVSHV